MKKALTYLTLFDLIFILLLSVSGYIGGVIGSVVYYAAFIVPIAIALAMRRQEGVSYNPPKFKISGEGISITAAAAAPTLAAIFFVSWLTSLILSLFSKGVVSDVSGNLVTVILTHAVITALLEEMLFRYIPLAYLSGISKRCAVLASAIMFALVHCNLYQLPYALLAGIIFAVLDIAYDSIIPSLLLHFLNNLASIIWIRGAENTNFVIVYIVVLLAAALLSLVPIFALRKNIRARILPIFNDKSKLELSYGPVLLTAMALVIAVTSLEF